MVKKKFSLSWNFVFIEIKKDNAAEKAPTKLNINDLIYRLLCVGLPDKGLTKTVKESEIITLCSKSVMLQIVSAHY